MRFITSGSTGSAAPVADLTPRGAVVIGLALLVAGCAGSPPNEDAGIEEQRLSYESSLRGFYSSMATCLTENGFPAELNTEGNGVRRLRPPDEVQPQASDLNTAYDQCAQAAGGQPDPPPPPSESELQSLYALNLEVVDCLQDHGHPYTDPPSVETYVETYLASLQGVGSAPWTPYTAENPGAFEDCPQPSLVDLYRQR